MVTITDVTQFIDANVLHSKLYDSADDTTKQKAVNQALNTLEKYMSDVYKDRESIPVDDVAEQVLWLLKMDDSIQRAELGAMMITVDGIQVQLKDMERTLAPNLLLLYSKSSARKMRVARYTDHAHSNNRVGQHYPPSYYQRFGRY